MTLVSVVTISFNQARFLRECIDSIVSQTGVDVQFIVVDAGSTDGSREIIDSYGSKLIRIFESDSGPADGLNKGFAAAEGDIFCFVNSDDRLEPRALARVADIFAKSEVDVVSGASRIIDARGVFKRLVFSDKFHLVAAAYGQCILIQPSTFFSREVFLKSGGFNSTNKGNWDTELFVDMALAGATFKRVRDVLSAYRIYAESITGSRRLLGTLDDKDHSRIFQKILGIAASDRSHVLWRWFYLRRKILNLSDTFERMLRGSTVKDV